MGKRAISRTVVGMLVGALGLGSITLASGAAAADVDPVRDGSSSYLAAASCWDIKQKDPDSSDGAYWLQTSQLIEPERFYCDMTTDGGGWVMIGRGREGWEWRWKGRGTPRDVRQTIDGPAAFAPRYLPTGIVDGLLNGGRVDDLDDGVRLRRAANIAGTDWQEVQLDFSGRDRWSWEMKALHPLQSCTFNGTTYTPGTRTTADCRVSNDELRVWTEPNTRHDWKNGFSYGSNVSGSSASDSYLWEYNGQGHAIPFTQVFIRPKVTEADIATDPIPDEGLPGETVTARISEETSPATPWGVTGVIGNPSNEFDTEVQALKQVGDTMYVGGHFRYVQKGPNPDLADKVEQSWLAAFDVETGEWKSQFRPQLNNNVWDIEPLPNGNVAVAGSFTEVNGNADYAGLVSLDPQTGEVTEDWGVRVESRSSTPSRYMEVKALDTQDGFLYFGGDFTHTVDLKNLDNDGNPTEQTINRIGRMTLSDYEVSWTWRPQPDGSVWDIDASSRGDNVYISGFFLNMNGEPFRNAGILSADDPGEPIPGQAAFVPSRDAAKTYQQAILEVGDRVWVGGSEHNTWMNDRDSFELLRGHITMRGGDTQALAANDGVIYVGGHFRDTMYQDSRTWSDPRPFKQADGVNWLAAFDAQTGEYMPDFLPSISSPRKRGPFALTFDSNDCLWFGADFDGGAWSGGQQQWLGSFGKLCPRDTTAPEAPANLSASQNGTAIDLAWDASPGTSYYQIFENDRVVATSWNPGATVELPEGQPSRFFVRAVDDEGNMSATTSVVETAPPAQTTTVVDAGAPFAWHYGDVAADGAAGGGQDLVPADATWSWRYQDSAPATAWADPDFDDSSWEAGVGEFGYGDGDENTVLPTGGTPHPVSAQFRTTFNVADPAVDAATLRLLRDDGAIAYLNGTEITRSNMPDGDIAHDTLASGGFWDRSLETEFQLIDVDPSLLVAGENTLAVQVHQANAWSNDLSFAADLIASVADTPAAAWNEPGFDDASWAIGSGQFGFGDGDEDTPIDPSTDPNGVSAQFRHTFNVADASAVGSLVLNVIRDDGVVVYLNGVEVARDNMPAGEVDVTTSAAGAVWGSAERDPQALTIDPSALKDGENTLAISVHNDGRNGPDLSFEVVSLDALG